MNSVNLRGVTGPSGISNAFSHMSSALNAVTEVSFGEEFKDFYVHGLPRKTERLLKEVPKFVEGNNIAYWVWESSELDDAFYKYARYYKEIWTASEYCAEILKPLNLPVKVFPHCATRFSYQPETGNDKPVILVSLSYASRILRKNIFFAIDTLLELVKSQEFKVIIKVLHTPPVILKSLQDVAAGLDVEWVTEELTVLELDQLYAQTDILYSPHKSEGFGLHLLEAMAFGKRVVASEYGGNKEFMSDETGYLIPCKEDEVDDGFYSGVWGYPDRDSAIDLLKLAIADGPKKSKAAFKQSLNYTEASLITKLV